jgi:GH25 family lysozyme M1 (1,4-beta-N-acetylmuramidase)
MTDILGVDVSHWQGDIDWDMMTQRGVRFAFLKLSEHDSYKDDTFTPNYNACKKRGILTGAYHFVRMNITAKDQYENIIGALDGRKLDMFALDCETNDNMGPKECTKVVRGLATMCQSIGGVELPTIYTRKSWWDRFINRSNDWAKLPLWVANWDTTYPLLPLDWTYYTVWQYRVHKGAAVYGVDGDLDLNKWNPGIPFPGTAPIPEPSDDVVTGAITINGVRYKLVRE